MILKEQELFDHITYNRIEDVKLMIKENIDVDCKSLEKGSPLFHAVCDNKIDLVNILLKAGADPNYRSKEGVSPIYAAISNGHIHLLDLLLQYCDQKDKIDDQMIDEAIKICTEIYQYDKNFIKEKLTHYRKKSC